MDNYDALFEKIEAKEKEWEEQVKYLRLKFAGLDSETHIKIEKQLNNLHMKLKEIEKRTREIKKISSKVHNDVGDKIIHSWIELLTRIDSAMLKLKK